MCDLFQVEKTYFEFIYMFMQLIARVEYSMSADIVSVYYDNYN